MENVLKKHNFHHMNSLQKCQMGAQMELNQYCTFMRYKNTFTHETVQSRYLFKCWSCYEQKQIEKRETFLEGIMFFLGGEVIHLLCFVSLLLQEYPNKRKPDKDQREVDESVSSVIFCRRRDVSHSLISICERIL